MGPIELKGGEKRDLDLGQKNTSPAGDMKEGEPHKHEIFSERLSFPRRGRGRGDAEKKKKEGVESSAKGGGRPGRRHGCSVTGKAF